MEAQLQLARIEVLCSKAPYEKHFYHALCTNPALLESTIRGLADKPLSWYILSDHPVINWKLVKDHIDKKWDWMTLTSKADWDVIEQHPDWPWDWEQLSYRPNVLKHIHEPYPWSFENICNNPHVTWDDVIRAPDWPWNYKKLCEHAPITLDFIRDHPEIPFLCWPQC